MERNIAVLFGLMLTTVLVSPGPTQDLNQNLKQKADVMTGRLTPRIDSVIPEYKYPNAINLVLNGAHFPNSQAGAIRRQIRLVQAAVRGDVFFMGGNRSWTASKIETFLSPNVIPGRRYRAGIVEWSIEALNRKKLISNEVEFLLLIKIESVDPSPVPLGAGEIEVVTANALGPKGSKIVKFAGRQATITKWEGFEFRFIIPAGVARPATHELFVEEDGKVVSTKFSVKLLGPVIGGN